MVVLVTLAVAIPRREADSQRLSMALLGQDDFSLDDPKVG